jgi:hypothetical protein
MSRKPMIAPTREVEDDVTRKSAPATLVEEIILQVAHAWITRFLGSHKLWLEIKQGNVEKRQLKS